MTNDFCIWCAEKKEYTEGNDPRKNDAIYCINCPNGHHYCLTKKFYEEMVQLGDFRGRKLDLAQYEEYCERNENSSSDNMLVIGRDFHIEYS